MQEFDSSLDAAQVQHGTNGAQHQNGYIEYSNGNHAASNGYADVITPATTSGTLDPKHRAQLADESAISAEAIEARGYFTQTDRQALHLLGFEKLQCLPPTLVIPLYNYRGEIAGFALRPDIPRNGKNGKPIKYELPEKSSPILDVAPLTCDQIDDPTKPLLITEGAKKADSAASRGLCAINLNGVYGFRGRNAKGGITALEDWDNIALSERAVYVVFDSDVATKPQVDSALRRLCAVLQSRGAIVKVVYLPDAPNGKKQGLDDFFTNGGTVADMFALARDLEPVAEKQRKAKKAKNAAKVSQLEARGVARIETNDGQLNEKLGEFAAAIATFNGDAPTLFNSAHGLTEIGRNSKGEAVLRGVVRERMQVLASKAATWISTTEREGIRDVAPPRELCTQYLVSPDAWQNVPDIERILSAPFVDRHGKICATPGYHESEKIWLSLPDNFQLPDTTPTPDNIEYSKRLILDTLLGEVAFADQSSRANALGLMLLPFVQRTIDGFTPLHLFDAPTQSSGKTYAAQICIAPFREIAPSAYKKNNDENQKELFARLMSGPSHVFTDNITGDLSDPTLATAITEKYLDGRVLGFGRTEVVSTRVVWVGTSNNAQLCKDALSRSILIRLNTGEENPESRQFTLKPVRYIAQDRPQVLAAIFTLIRAWLDAGRPLYAKPTRSRFDEWEQTIGGILEVIGIDGFLDNHKEARAEMDTEAREWREFVATWHADHGTNYLTTKELLPVALKCEELAARIGEKDQVARLGRALREKRDVVFGGLKISRAAGSSRVAHWRVFPVKPEVGENVHHVHHVHLTPNPTRNVTFLSDNTEKENKTKECHVSLTVCSDPHMVHMVHIDNSLEVEK